MVTRAWLEERFCTSTMRGFKNPDWGIGVLCASLSAGLLRYFEYSSMIRLSLIVDDRSARAGLFLNVPLRPLVSTSIHSGRPRDSAASEEALMRSWLFALLATSTTSPGRTGYEGMLTRLPFTRMPLWRTSCRASVLEAPKPMR